MGRSTSESSEDHDCSQDLCQIANLVEGSDNDCHQHGFVAVHKGILFKSKWKDKFLSHNTSVCFRLD